MAGDLQGQGTGVVQQAGTATQTGTGEPKTSGAVATGGAPSETTAATQPARAADGQGGARVQLEQLEDFRRYQAGRDQETARLKREAAEARQAAQQARDEAQRVARELQQLRLQNADPEDQAEYYRQEAERIKAEVAQQETQRQQAREYEAQAIRMLQNMGLDPDADADALDWKGGPTPDGLVRLIDSATELVKLRSQVGNQDAQRQASEVEANARAQALVEAGVVGVSTAAGGDVAPGLRQQYEKEKAALRGTGRTQALLDLRKRYKEQGLDL